MNEKFFTRGTILMLMVTVVFNMLTINNQRKTIDKATQLIDIFVQEEKLREEKKNRQDLIQCRAGHTAITMQDQYGKRIVGCSESKFITGEKETFLILNQS